MTNTNTHHLFIEYRNEEEEGRLEFQTFEDEGENTLQYLIAFARKVSRWNNWRARWHIENSEYQMVVRETYLAWFDDGTPLD